MTLNSLVSHFQRHSRWLIPLFIIVTYMFSRWFLLTSLPVFADEAIYIRWSQLLRQGNEYLFFSMNDGKPPLFVWTLYPWLSAFSDPLWAARSWSAVVGLLQLGVIVGILRTLKQNRTVQTLGALLVLFVPFWFLHHRLALMDGLLTLGISCAWWGLLQLDQVTSNGSLTNKSKSLLSKIARAIALAGIGWGVALITKTTALFFAPVFLGVALIGLTWDIRAVFGKKSETSTLLLRLVSFGIAGAIGLACFALLRVHPAFGSLFSRSSDFTYSISDWLELGGRPVWDNLLRVTPWLAQYLRPELLTFAAASLFLSRNKRLHLGMWVAGLISIAPLIIFGKTLHARYFLPIVPFITLSAVCFAWEAWIWIQSSWEKKQREAGILAIAVGMMFFLACVRFQLLLQMSPQLTPFVLDDRTQYLTSWAAGYGIPETRDLLLSRARDGQRTTVVTEGSFGTLPDGLLMYFDRAPEIQHLRIEGLEQFPVRTLPDWVIENARTEETWLLVNEDRFALLPDQVAQTELIGKTFKPYGGPPLLLFRITPDRE